MARGRGKLTPQDKEYMKIFSTNLNNVLSERNCKQAELSRATGIPASTLTGYVKGTSLPIPGNVQKIADFFGLLKSDLDPRFSSTATTSTTLQAIQSVSERLSESRRVIVLDTAKKQLDEQERAESEVSDVLYLYRYYDHAASAGTGQYLTEVAVEHIELPVEIDADFVIPIYGDSMEPDYHDGDYIFVKLSLDLANGDIGVFDYEGDAYVKQLIIEDGQAYLHSLNPDYPDKPITPETNFRIIGEVVGRYAKEK